MAKRLTHYLLLALVLTLGFGQLLRFEVAGIPIFLHDILVLILIALNLQGLTLKGSRYTQPLRLIFLGLTIGAVRALTLFPISDLLIPALYSLRLIAYLFLYPSLCSKPLAISRTPFLIAGLISLAIGLAQYFFMPDMRIFQYLGWDDHLSRLTLPHFDPTFSAAFLAVSLLFSLPLKSPLIYHLALTLGILLTYSRSIWLSLALTATLFIKRKTTLLLTIVAIITAILLLPASFGEGTNLLRTYSINSRLSHDLDLAGRVGGNFITGIGYNSLPLIIEKKDETPNHAASFNNSFLTILATSGIIGLLGWFLFLRSLYYEHARLRPILIFLVIGSFFNNLLLYPFTLLLLLLMAPSATSR